MFKVKTLAFDDLVKAGALDALPPAAEALSAFAAADKRLADAEAALQAAITSEDTRSRKKAIPQARDSRDLAQEGVDAERIELKAARTTAFEVAKPILQREAGHRLPAVLAALEQLDAAVAALLEVEQLADRYVLPPGASVAPGRHPLADARVGAELAAIVHRWRPILERVRRSSAA